MKQEWRRDSTKTPTDIISWLLKATDEDHNFGPSGDEALCDDGRLAIIAGRYVDYTVDLPFNC